MAQILLDRQFTVIHGVLSSRWCIIGAPINLLYFMNSCIVCIKKFSVGTVDILQQLRSAARGLLLVPLMPSASTTQFRSFAFVGSSSWNDLPRQLHLQLLRVFTLPLPLSLDMPEDYLVC